MIHCNNCYILSVYGSDINDLTCDRCTTKNCLRCTFVQVTNNKIINKLCVKCFSVSYSDCGKLTLPSARTSLCDSRHHNSCTTHTHKRDEAVAGVGDAKMMRASCFKSMLCYHSDTFSRYFSRDTFDINNQKLCQVCGQLHICINIKYYQCINCTRTHKLHLCCKDYDKPFCRTGKLCSFCGYYCKQCKNKINISKCLTCDSNYCSKHSACPLCVAVAAAKKRIKFDK
jgi:hypothetical protein